MMKRLLRKKRILYTNCDIPATLFFDELVFGNMAVLGKGSPEELQAAYLNIIDEYCLLKGNRKMLSWFLKQNKISKLQLAITTVEACLRPIKYICVTKEQYEKCIKVINSIQYPKVRFNFDAPLHEEIYRVENSIIGMLRNELNTNLEGKENQKATIEREFSKRLVSVENVLGRSIDESVTLRKFIFLEKSAIEKAK